MEKILTNKIIKIFESLDIPITIEEVTYLIHFLNNVSTLSTKIDELKILQKTVFNFEEVCSYLKISKSHLYKLTSQRVIPHFCPQGKKLYFKREEIDIWLLLTSSAEEIENVAIDYVFGRRKKDL
ncbi:MAG: helix-turn-helix domain-containing protein [Chitinophagaceae bacterium]